MIRALEVALAAGAGAAARHVVNGLVVPRQHPPEHHPSEQPQHPRAPWGILVVNLTGTAALGVLVGLHTSGRLGTGTLAVLGTGLLGGYTTFSTFTWQLLEQARAGRARVAVGYALASVALGVVAAAAAVSLTLAATG